MYYLPFKNLSYALCLINNFILLFFYPEEDLVYDIYSLNLKGTYQILNLVLIGVTFLVYCYLFNQEHLLMKGVNLVLLSKRGKVAFYT